MTSPTLRAALVLAATTVLACAGRAALHPRAAEQLERGYRHLAAGDAEAAEVAFEHALELDAELPEALNGMGVVARTRGELEDARRRFERAVRVDPRFAEGHANLGETLLALGHDRAGEDELRRALELDPDLADARQNLARVHLRRGLAEGADRAPQWARARRAYLHVLEAEPDRAAAHHDLAYMDFVEGRFERAERGYRRAAALAPESVEAHHGLCISLVRLGRCDEAARACEACLAVSPGAAACRTSLAGARACAAATR